LCRLAGAVEFEIDAVTGPAAANAAPGITRTDPSDRRL
jgi:hypothetical protein